MDKDNLIKKWPKLIETYGTLKEFWPEDYHKDWDDLQWIIKQKDHSKIELDNLMKDTIMKKWQEAEEMDQWISNSSLAVDVQPTEEFINKIIVSNPHLEKSSWFEQIRNLFQELLPQGYRKLSYAMIALLVMVSFASSWVTPLISTDSEIVTFNPLEDTSQIETYTSIISGDLWNL